MVDGRVQEANRGDVVGKQEDEGEKLSCRATRRRRTTCFLEAQDRPSKLQATLAMDSAIRWEMWTLGLDGL